MSGAVQPSGTVTLVFTDIEGSTRLLEQLGVEGYREALAEHRRIVREACARHSGYEVDTEGDAFFYAFQSAQHAVEALSEAMAGLQGGPIRIRVGIHTGEPALDPPNYLGLDVHRAARIMSAGHGGQVVLSPTTVALLDHSVTLKPLGEHRLKDMSAPIPLHQLQLDGLPDEFPPLKTLYHSNLPIPATPFLGRDQELTQITQQLSDPDTRLLTLTGPGGTGKTRLALQAAADSSDHYPDGTWWIPLASLRDPALVLAPIGAALDVKERADEPLAETIARALSGKRTLVVADNLEHLLPAAAGDLGRLIDACPTLRLLVTSRARLALEAERVFPVPAMSPSDGEQLFVESARAVGVALVPDDSVRALCRRLDELPLAIRLAAARTRSLSAAAILDRLDRRLSVLTSATRDVDERQRTLEATIAWSYDLLSPDEQRVFRALSVFAGGCTLEAAEEVAGAGLDEIETLVDQSLLGHRVDEAGQDRYWMLETIREYAHQQLEAETEAPATESAHAVAYARSLSPLWHGVRNYNKNATSLLESDLDNGRLALDRALAAGDGASASPLLLVLHVVLMRRGSTREALAFANRYLELDRSAMDVATRLDGDVGAGEILRHAGDRARAAELKREGLDVARRFPETQLLGPGRSAENLVMALLSDLASLELALGDVSAARVHASESVERRRATGMGLGIAHALFALAMVERVAGELESSAAYLAEAAELAEESGTPEVSSYRAWEADGELLCGRLDSAVRLLASHPPANLDDKVELMEWLVIATHMLAASERHAEASATCTAALALIAETGLDLDPWDRERLDRADVTVREALGGTAPHSSADPDPHEAVELARSALAQLVSGIGDEHGAA